MMRRKSLLSSCILFCLVYLMLFACIFTKKLSYKVTDTTELEDVVVLNHEALTGKPTGKIDEDASTVVDLRRPLLRKQQNAVLVETRSGDRSPSFAAENSSDEENVSDPIIHVDEIVVDETTFTRFLLDESYAPHPCGTFKCFFQRKRTTNLQAKDGEILTNDEHEEMFSSTKRLMLTANEHFNKNINSSGGRGSNMNTGFLISKYRVLYHNEAQKAWELAMNFTSNAKEYDMDHIYIGPPFEISAETLMINDEARDEVRDDEAGDDDEVGDDDARDGEARDESRDEIARSTSKGTTDSQSADTMTMMPFGEWLDRNITRHVGDSSSKGIPKYHTYKSFLIHEVKALQDNHNSSEPSLFFGCSDNKLINGGWNKVENDFLRPILSGTSDDDTNGRKDLKQIHDELQKQSIKLRDVLQNKYPCLYHDFQIFLRSNGRFLHFDMDRCFYNKKMISTTRPAQKRCQTRIDDLINFILQALDTGVIPQDKPEYVTNSSYFTKNI